MERSARNKCWIRYRGSLILDVFLENTAELAFLMHPCLLERAERKQHQQSVSSAYADPKGFDSHHPATGLDPLFRKHPYATEVATASMGIYMLWGQTLASNYPVVEEDSRWLCSLGEWAKDTDLESGLPWHLCLASFSSKSEFPHSPVYFSWELFLWHHWHMDPPLRVNFWKPDPRPANKWSQCRQTFCRGFKWTSPGWNKCCSRISELERVEEENSKYLGLASE